MLILQAVIYQWASVLPLDFAGIRTPTAARLQSCLVSALSVSSSRSQALKEQA